MGMVSLQFSGEIELASLSRPTVAEVGGLSTRQGQNLRSVTSASDRLMAWHVVVNIGFGRRRPTFAVEVVAPTRLEQNQEHSGAWSTLRWSVRGAICLRAQHCSRCLVSCDALDTYP